MNTRRLDIDSYLAEDSLRLSKLDDRITELIHRIQDLTHQCAPLLDEQEGSVRSSHTELISERSLLIASTAQCKCSLAGIVSDSALSHALPIATAACGAHIPPKFRLSLYRHRIPTPHSATTILLSSPLELGPLSQHFQHLSLFHFAQIWTIPAALLCTLLLMRGLPLTTTCDTLPSSMTSTTTPVIPETIWPPDSCLHSAYPTEALYLPLA